MEKCIELIKEGQFYEDGLEWSMLILIEPIDFDLSKSVIFYPDFCFLFLSSSKDYYDIIYKFLFEKVFEVPHTLCINIDRLQEKMKEISGRALSEERIFDLMELYSEMVLINSETKYLVPLSYNFLCVDCKMMYIGSKNIELDEIYEQFWKKLDSKTMRSSKKDKTLIFWSGKPQEIN